MLLSFRVANHRSLRDEQQLLLTPSHADDSADWQAVPVAGIFGANASGKSNVLNAMLYMTATTLRSFGESEPGAGIYREHFALDPAMSREASTFVVDLLREGVRYTYGFAVDDTQVIEEWMYSYPRKRQRTIFHRQGDDYHYGEHSPDSMRRVEFMTEPNVLFMSVAARARQPILRPVFSWFAGLMIKTLRMQMAPSPSRYLDRITSLLRAADTGIENAEIVKEPNEDYERILFSHRGSQGAVRLRLQDQSDGTQALYHLGLPAFRALDKGLPLIVDELDSSLHPFLTAQIVRLFRDPETNPKGAQLIFTSHDATLLGRIQGAEILHRDHVWFTEKDGSGATELFPLSAFKPRREDNYERRYLAGRYGAVPVVKDELFFAALAARGDADDASK